MPEAPWNETEEAGSVVLAFDGIDAEAREASELAAFTRDLKANPRAPVSDTPILYLVASGIGVLVGYLASQIGQILVPTLGSSGTLAAFLIGLLAPAAFVALRQAVRSRGRAVRRGRFELRLDGSGFSVSDDRTVRGTFDLSAIDGFEGGTRLTLRTRDGARHALACALPSAAANVALALRLDDALAAVRASRGSYRGEHFGEARQAQVRVAGLPDDAETEDDAPRSDTPGAPSRRRRSRTPRPA